MRIAETTREPTACSATASSSDDTATVIAVGVLAATLAAVCHETLGHVLGCLGSGGHVKLLTSIWFRCSKWSVVADAGGPAGNLVAGCLAVALLRRSGWSATVRLFLLLSAGIDLFWFTGQLAFESLTSRHDDWSWALQMGWPSVQRWVGAVVGIGGYVLAARVVAALHRKETSLEGYAIRLGYAAAAASAILAGLMWRPEPLRTALEGFLTLGALPFALLSIARNAGRDGEEGVGARAVPRSWVWIAVCGAIFGVFLFVQARGLGSMATSRLSP